MSGRPRAPARARPGQPIPAGRPHAEVVPFGTPLCHVSAMLARSFTDLLHRFHEEEARLRARIPSLGLSPMAQGQLRMVANRLDADTAADESRRGVLDGYLAARLQERLDLVRALPALVAEHLAASPPDPADDGLWIADLVAARLHPHAPQPRACRRGATTAGRAGPPAGARPPQMAPT